MAQFCFIVCLQLIKWFFEIHSNVYKKWNQCTPNLHFPFDKDISYFMNNV